METKNIAKVKKGIIEGICYLSAAAVVAIFGVLGTKVIYHRIEQSKLEERVRLEYKASHELLRSVHLGDTLIYTPTEYNLLTDLDGDRSSDVLTVKRFFPSSYGSKPEPKYFIKKGTGLPQSPGDDAVFVEPEFFEKYNNLMR